VTGVAPATEVALAHLDSLPTLPPVAVRILQLTSNPNAELAPITELLRGDQSLSARILAVASSAMFAGKPMTTLDRAIVTLGFGGLRSIVLAAKVFECFAPRDRKAPTTTFHRSEFWKHSLAVACAARRLAAARKAPAVAPDEAYVAGLLHDLGKVALDAVFPKAYERIASQADQTGADIADCEEAILGIAHMRAGKRLAERWGLPQPLQEAIWLHHFDAATLPATVQSRGLVALVRLADLLAREQRIGYSGNHVFRDGSSRLGSELGFSPADIDAAARELVADVAEQAALLGLERETSEALYYQSLARANAELARVNAELEAGNRGLSAAARYLRAIAEFDRLVSAVSDTAEIVSSLAAAATIALGRPLVAAFGTRSGGRVLEIAWTGEGPAETRRRTELATADASEWLSSADERAEASIVRLPHAMSSDLSAALAQLGADGDPWLIPLAHQGMLLGGLVVRSTLDERQARGNELPELRAFLRAATLALAGAHAQAAARSLSEDLADANRRLQHLQGELLASRTLGMIAEMAPGAGHELNGPLTVISGRAQMLAASLTDPEARKSLEQIVQKAHECSRIVTDLMDFAQPAPPQKVAFELRALLAEARDEALRQHNLAASRIRLEPDAAGTSGETTLLADRAQIKTVVKELLANAVDATSYNNGGIRIRCAATRREHVPAGAPATRAAVAADQQPSAWIELVIADDGLGMSPGTLQRAFAPFFSHRPAGRARGLGLPRAQRIVEAHGGRIWLESREGQGTTASVVLPRGEG
jgi:putative nucleotidyltransferase with HDIG domain